MPHYVVLYKFTDQGRRNIKGTVQRAEAILRENTNRCLLYTSDAADE